MVYRKPRHHSDIVCEKVRASVKSKYLHLEISPLVTESCRWSLSRLFTDTEDFHKIILPDTQIKPRVLD